MRLEKLDIDEQNFEMKLAKARPMLDVSAIGGAIAGVAIGAFVGPVGMIVGGILGTGIGVIVGTTLDTEAKKRAEHDLELDEEIGVEGGDMGTPPSTKRPQQQAKPLATLALLDEMNELDEVTLRRPRPSTP
jgi:hypothetical protein